MLCRLVINDTCRSAEADIAGMTFLAERKAHFDGAVSHYLLDFGFTAEGDDPESVVNVEQDDRSDVGLLFVAGRQIGILICLEPG